MTEPLRHIATCTTCGKRCYTSKAVAKRVARSLKGDRSGGHLSAYRCGTYWHLGHLPSLVVRGVIGRDEIRDSGGNE